MPQVVAHASPAAGALTPTINNVPIREAFLLADFIVVPAGEIKLPQNVFLMVSALMITKRSDVLLRVVVAILTI